MTRQGAHARTVLSTTKQVASLSLIAFVAVCALTISSCKRAQQSQKDKQGNVTAVDTTQDTTRGFFGEKYDSLSSKVSNTVSNIFNDVKSIFSKDTTKGVPVTVPPPTEQPDIVNGPPPELPGFLPAPIKRKVEFDSNGNVIARDVFLGGDVRQPQQYTFEDYLRHGEENSLDRGFEQVLHKQIDTGKSVDAQTGILGDYGNISIPIPPSIVPTIFGRPSINLRVNGDVAIHLAYRDQQTYATTGSQFFGSETGLDFKQEINVSTNGTIGDKLKIGADWGSDRMFQFDNLLKFNYVGYPDEIIQSFDAGNVTFNTPSKYIGIQNDLFGLKAVSRFGPVYFTTMAAQKKGERQSKNFGGGGAGQAAEHLVRPWEYRRNRFFLDTSYIQYYEPYCATIPRDPQVVISKGGEYLPKGLGGNDIQVWTMTRNTTAELKTFGVAWYNLPILTSNTGTYKNQYPADDYQHEPLKTHTNDTVQSGNWLKMDSTRYTYDPYTGILILNQEPEDQETALAVSYPVYQNNAPKGRYGEQGLGNAGETIILKLIKPVGTFKRTTFAAWRNIVKNTYYVGGQSFTDKDFQLRIFYQNPRGGQQVTMTSAKHPQPYAISVMGLDRYQNSNPGDATADKQTDFGSQFTQDDFILEPKTGTLVFPYLEPFGDRVKRFYQAQTQIAGKPLFDSNFYLPEVYTRQQEDLRNKETKQVSISIRFSGGVSATLNLNAYNLVEGSVKVTVGATQLVEGTDFRVDYNSGTVTILKPDLVTAGQISVEYDQHDIFTNATKNVLGFRAEVPIMDAMNNSKGTIGTTFMNYSMHLPTLKTRQGEEPLSNWIWGFDGSYKFDLPQLTDALNALPLFNLKDKSELTVKADAALSLPNPNTQKSPMDVDNGASIAYVDDFEGGMNQFPLYLNYGRWHPSSQPADSEFLAKYQVPNPDTNYWNNRINRLKGRMMWWWPTDMPPITEIKPQKSVSPGQTAQVMHIDFDPNRAGIYNPNPEAGPAQDKWGGLIQYAAGLNVAATNTDAVQLWVKIDGISPADVPTAKLRLDLGRISEDVIPDGRLENEDANNNGSYDDSPNEDLGLDGMDDVSERSFFASKNVAPSDPNDPNNDDYSSTPVTQEYGQEGNHTDANYGRKPDNEDLDGNGIVNLENSYYEYDIPLLMDPNVNKYIIGNTNNTWFQLRIPLGDFTRLVGTQDSSFSNISYYRIWINGVQQDVHVELYDLALVGSQWTRGSVGLSTTNPIGDSSLRISFVDFEENGGPPTNYSGPPGVQRDIIPGQTTTTYANEQSLNMQLKGVPCGSRRQAERIFPAPNDLFNYRSMAIWVHGDGNGGTKISDRPLTSVSDSVNRVWVYIRFGTDQFNYYEYRRPLLRGWQNMHVDFGTLTSLKARRSAQALDDSMLDPAGVPGSEYKVIGSPTLTNAQYFVLGVENEDMGNCSLTTDVWWDELRLLEANDQIDYAYTGTAELKLAEFGRIMAGMTNERPDFHRVDERFNYGRSLNLLWNVTGEFATEKMFPKTWTDKGAKLPITISHSESVLRPKYIVNTDINITQTVSDLQATGNSQDRQTADSLLLNNETLQVKNSFGASDIALRFPGSFFLLPAFVNRLNFGFGYAETFMRSPQYEYNRQWSWTASARYSLPPLPQWSVSPLSWLLGSNTFFFGPYSQWKISPFPNSVSFGVSATRGREHSLNRLSTLSFPGEGSAPEDTADVLNSRQPLLNRVFTATRNMQINWKPFEGGLLSPGFDYSLDVTSNLVPLETYSTFNVPVGYDASGNPIYNYDSAYYYQRSLSEITHDIFFKDGALARLGQDYNADQKVHMTTSPRLPSLFGVEKIFKPVFDYRVDYRWLNAQTGFQNAKQGAWNNTITTGVELNVRELGTMIFGKPVGEEQPQTGRGARRGGDIGVIPEEMRGRSGEERESPPGYPRQQPRNPVERGEDMRIQAPPNPLGDKAHLLDTMHRRVEVVPGPDTAGKIHARGIGTEGEKGGEYAIDTVLTPEAPAPEVPEYAEVKPSITVKGLLQKLVQTPLFDWNGTRFNFTQTNQSLNNALMGNGSGITNFLARGIFTPEDDINGPSRAYQLGLITDPSGRLLFHWNNKFPFVSFGVRHGLRQDDPNGGSTNVTDAFTETNNFELSTSRPLWSGASINLNWKLSFGYDERDALLVDHLGQPNLQYQIKSGDVSRTFLSIPPLPFLGEGVAQSGILSVGQKYREAVIGAGATTVDSAHLQLAPDTHNRIEREAFMTGFESLPILTWLREYLPQLNYSFSWSGLEKSLFWFSDHASVRNAYNGTYKRIFRQDPGDSLTLTSLQTVIYGFRPLIAFDISWDHIMSGQLTASLNYDTQTEWAADYASTRITKRLSTTFGINAHYNRAGGISIPFLKLNLKNQFGAQFTFSQTVSEDNYYNFWTIESNPAGTSNGGLTKTTIEPRINYTISNQVQIEGFYRYERTTPAQGALTAPPTRLIMAGIDMRLKIM